MANIETARRRKRSDEVREKLLDLIRDRSLRPGDIVPSERELMATFGVGRPVVREAMQSLEGLGLIVIRHGERPRVAEPSMPQMLGQIGTSIRHVLQNSETSLEHLKDARVMFEAQMARLAAMHGTHAQISDLERIMEAQNQVQDNAKQFLELDGQFHGKIAEMSANPIFAALGQSLFDWLAEFHRSLVRAPDLEHLTLDEHRAILDAIRGGDSDAAARHMTDHINRANTLYHRV